MRLRYRLFVAVLTSGFIFAACTPKAPPVIVEPVEEQIEHIEPPTVVLPEPYDTRTLRTRSNVRSEPSANAGLVGTYDAGTEIGLLKLSNGWFNVRIDSVLGWVYAPLVNMTASDRFAAAISVLSARTEHDGLFVSKFQAENGDLNLVLDFTWRDMSNQQKQRVVERTGDLWKNATESMGITPPPAIHFMSNNDVEMARWHGFWGAQVFY